MAFNQPGEDRVGFLKMYPGKNVLVSHENL